MEFSDRSGGSREESEGIDGRSRGGCYNRYRTIRLKDRGHGLSKCLEVVGMSPALKMGFELMRPWGVISSVGVHNAEV